MWTALTVLKLAPLLLLLAAWILYTGPATAPPAAVPGAGWLRAGLTAMFACQGFEVVPVIAGQVRSSARAVPRATVGSLILSVTLYVITSYSIHYTKLYEMCFFVLNSMRAVPS